MFDVYLKLQDEATIAADQAGQVDAAAQILDLGPGVVNGFMILDVDSIEVASGDEKYNIRLEGCARSDFAYSTTVLCEINLGAKGVLPGADRDSETGQYAIPFTNVKNGEIWRYVRLYVDVSGAIATGITMSARLDRHTTTTTTTLAQAGTTTTTT